MKARITQSDVARAAGVHNATVSLSLRNSRLIPPETRERIQAIARSMGYSPDPALRALVAYRNSQRVRRERDTLAYITHWDSKWGWKNLPSHERAFFAAQARATDLGYQLEHLWLGDPGMSRSRLDRVLTHGNIRGVLLASHLAPCEELAALDWSRLSAVKIGSWPHGPALNQVTLDPFAAMRLALQHIQAGGYQRVGFVVPRRHDELADGGWSAAFHATSHRCALKDRLPILQVADPLEASVPAGAFPRHSADDTRTLSQWYRQHRPEVIIGATPGVLGLVRQCGLHVPRDVAYVDLDLESTGYVTAGVWQNCEKVGAAATAMLVHQLEQNAFGLPDSATVTSVGGTWREGASLPAKAPETIEDRKADGLAPLSQNLVA